MHNRFSPFALVAMTLTCASLPVRAQSATTAADSSTVSPNATAVGPNATAVGPNATAVGPNATAVGPNANNAVVQPPGPEQSVAPVPSSAPNPRVVPPPEPRYESVDAQSPELSPIATRRNGEHLHDGFFMRFGLGVTWLSLDGTMALSGSSQPFKMRGTGVVLPFLIGGTPTPGFVIGGGFLAHTFSNPTYEYGGISAETSDTTLTVGMIGLFTQIYPVPTAGFFVHGMLAIGSDSAKIKTGDTTVETEDANGWALSAAVGYDFWVGKQWSIGPELRISYVSTTYSGAGPSETHEHLLPALALAATWH